MWSEPAKAMSYVSIKQKFYCNHSTIESILTIQQMQPQEEDEHDDEEMGVAETYADYWPSKCNLSI